MGRRKKPSALHDPAISHRPGNTKEPQPQRIAPPPPSHLKGEAKREWRRLASELERMGLLTECDRAAFAIYCEAWAEYIMFRGMLESEGWFKETSNGYRQPHEAVALYKQAEQKILKYGREFGLTPSSRTGIATDAPGNQDVDHFAELSMKLTE